MTAHAHTAVDYDIPHNLWQFRKPPSVDKAQNDPSKFKILQLWPASGDSSAWHVRVSCQPHEWAEVEEWLYDVFDAIMCGCTEGDEFYVKLKR